MVDAHEYLVNNLHSIVEGITKQSVKGASVDLRIDEIAQIRKDTKTLLLSEQETFSELFEEVNLSKGFALQPGQYLLGKTYEKINIPLDRCGLVLPRSTFARLGLHLPISQYANPGYSGHLPICIYNFSQVAVEIPPYYRVVQLLLLSLNGQAKPYESQIDKKYFKEDGKNIYLNDEELMSKRKLTLEDLQALGVDIDE